MMKHKGCTYMGKFRHPSYSHPAALPSPLATVSHVLHQPVSSQDFRKPQIYMNYIAWVLQWHSCSSSMIFPCSFMFMSMSISISILLKASVCTSFWGLCADSFSSLLVGTCFLRPRFPQRSFRKVTLTRKNSSNQEITPLSSQAFYNPNTSIHKSQIYP